MSRAIGIAGRLFGIAPALAAVALLGLTAPADAATAPSALTGPTTSTGSSSAAVTATVDPNGLATSAYFELGTTTAYGTSSPSASVGDGTSEVAFDYTFTGLSADTTYHYRVVATSSAGTTDGTDGIFTTAATGTSTTTTTTTTTTTGSTGPAATTAAATSVTSTSASLNGSVNPNGQETSWYFEYGPTTSYGSKTAVENAGSGTTSTAVSTSVSKLTAKQLYHFRLVATNAAGTSDGADMSFTPGSGPTVATKAATSVTSTSATLNGTVDPNGAATTWYFEYGPTTSYGSKTAVTSAGDGGTASTVSTTVDGLEGGVYHYRLVATSAAGTAEGSDLTFGSLAPVALTGTAQGVATTGITLTGSVNPEGNATGWYFEYGTTGSYGMKTPETSAGSGSAPTGVSAAIAKLAAGTTYHYRLVATSSLGTTLGEDVTFTTVPAVTIATSTLQSVYGHLATLSGVVSTRQSGLELTVVGEPLGKHGYATVGKTRSGNGGGWSLQVRPRLATSYEVRSPDGTSKPVRITVRPAVSLREITGERLSTRVSGSGSFAGKSVQLQRALAGGRWQTVARGRLNGRSSAIFAVARLPSGASTIRVAISAEQAGPGYLGGFSRTLSYRRA